MNQSDGGEHQGETAGGRDAESERGGSSASARVEEQGCAGSSAVRPGRSELAERRGAAVTWGPRALARTLTVSQ